MTGGLAARHGVLVAALGAAATACFWFLVFADPVAVVDAHAWNTPVAFLAASLANATAVGGGFVFVPWFILVQGQSAATATALSLATQAFGMTSGMLGWDVRILVWRALVRILPGAIGGVWVGVLYQRPNADSLRLAFTGVSVAVGVALVLEGAVAHRLAAAGSGHSRAVSGWRGLNPSACWAYLWPAALGFGGGLITAWTSIGVGEVVALYVLLKCRLPLQRAIASGVAALAVCSIVAFALHAYLGTVPYVLLAFTAPGVLLGGFCGARFGKFLETKTAHISMPFNLTPLRGVFLAVVALDSLVLWVVG